MSKYLEFYKSMDKPKTSVFLVLSKNSNDRLGEIKWFARWRCYAFFPGEETIFNSECLKDIKEFIDKLMEKRKKK